MPRFFGIAPGEERSAPGIRIRVAEDGERVWMHGKWLELGAEHAVVWIAAGERARFIHHDGTEVPLGKFPAWVCRGTGRRKAVAAMFNVGQFADVRIETAR